MQNDAVQVFNLLCEEHQALPILTDVCINCKISRLLTNPVFFDLTRSIMINSREVKTLGFLLCLTCKPTRKEFIKTVEECLKSCKLQIKEG